MDQDCGRRLRIYVPSNVYLQGNHQEAGYLFSGLFSFLFFFLIPSYAVWFRELVASTMTYCGFLVILQVFIPFFVFPPLVLETWEGRMYSHAHVSMTPTSNLGRKRIISRIPIK